MIDDGTGLRERLLAEADAIDSRLGVTGVAGLLREAASALPRSHPQVNDMDDLPVVQKTAPERIWLAVSDASLDSESAFPGDHSEICWSTDDPLEVCVPYVRADLAPAQPEGGEAVENMTAGWLAAVESLVSACEREFTSPDTDMLEDADDAVALPDSEITFGDIWRARDAIDNLRNITGPAPAQQAGLPFTDWTIDKLQSVMAAHGFTVPVRVISDAFNTAIYAASLTSTAAKAAEGAK